MGITPLERFAVNLPVARALPVFLVGLVCSHLYASQFVSTAQPTVMLILGAAGEPQYTTNFTQQLSLWTAACTKVSARQVTIGAASAGESSDFDQLKQMLASEPKDGADLWLVLIGHGTFDGKEARFNLRGPDVSATDFAAWLAPFHRRLAIIDTTACSAPFLTKLSATNRIIVTATRSGNEQSFARFGQYFAASFTNPEADLDKDSQVSLLEAFLIASRQVTEFYKLEGRLASEHALLDDNGDGLGTQADWFRGLRAIRKPRETAQIDGLLARQVFLIKPDSDKGLTNDQQSRRDALERAVFALREKKKEMPEEQYYKALEQLLIELAQLYRTNSLAPAPPRRLL
jgi:hypothetical protein